MLWRREREAYTWRVILDDGTSVVESEAGSFGNVPAERCRRLDLLPMRRGLRLSVQIPKGAKAVFFRRRSLIVRVDGRPSGPGETITCIGWENGTNCYLLVSNDGVLATDTV